MEESQPEAIKKISGIKKFLLAGAVIVVILVVVTSLNNDSTTEPTEIKETPEVALADKEEKYKNVPQEEIVSVSKEVLGILHRLYYVSIDTGNMDYETDSALILSWTTEAMKDKNTLQNLIPQAEALIKNKNKTVQTTALSLATGMMQLSNSQDTFIKYLRTVDPTDSDLAEFQYQVALFSSTNKEAFNTIIEGTSLFPYIYLDMEGDDDEENDILISPKEKEEIIAEIDRLFGDLFIEDDKEHELTGNRNAVIMIVRNYRDFITGEE